MASLGFNSVVQAKPLPKFGEWDVNDPSSAEDFSVIFNKARTEKKLGSQTDSLSKPESLPNHATVLGKPPSRKWFCCVQTAYAES